MQFFYLHESACLNVQRVYYEQRVHDLAADVNLHTAKKKSMLAKTRGHTPFFFPPSLSTHDVREIISTTCDCVHGSFLQDLRCTECYRLWISPPPSSRLFIPEDSSCILVGDLVPGSPLRRSSKGSVYFSIVSSGIM